MTVFKKTTPKPLPEVLTKKKEDGEEDVTFTEEDILNGLAYQDETADDIYSKDRVPAKIPNDVQTMLKNATDIDDILFKSYPVLLSKALLGTDTKARDGLIDLLTNGEKFASSLTHGNRDNAEFKVKTLLGARILPDIFAKYPNATDINDNGRIIFVDTGITGVGKVQYARTDQTDFPLTNSQKRLPIIREEDIIKFVEFFARRQNVNWNPSEPLLNAFVDNIRMSAVYNNISSTGTTFSLRISRPVLALNDNNFEPFAPMPVGHLLGEIAHARRNLMFCGETGTGKTEALKYFAKFIRPADRIIMVEDVAETQLYNLFPSKDVVAWHTDTHEDYATGETYGIGLTHLLKQSLRSYPRFVAVSELRGAETMPAYASMTAGNKLFATTHARSNRAVITRLIDMITMYTSKASPDAMRRELQINLDFSIHIERKDLSNGRALRYIDEIVFFETDAVVDRLRHKELDERRKALRALNKYSDDEIEREIKAEPTVAYDGAITIFKQSYVELEDKLERKYTLYDLPDAIYKKISEVLNYKHNELKDLWSATKAINPKNGKREVLTYTPLK